jgi:uncharacterized protein YndB with AHSA1/START domain
MIQLLEARVALIELAVSIAAPREKVWRALIEDTSRWWSKDFYVRDTAKGMVFEARVGGRLFEDWGEGAGVLWGTVFAFDPGRSFDLITHSSAAWGGPRTSMLHVELEDRDEGTLLKMSDSVQGRVDDASAASLHAGWTMLFGDGLKPFVET